MNVSTLAGRLVGGRAACQRRAPYTRPQQPGMFWAFGIGLAVAGLGLFLEGRQDFYKVAFFIAAAGVITAWNAAAPAEHLETVRARDS